jgi:Na+/melibiose symporter-like transporter
MNLRHDTSTFSGGDGIQKNDAFLKFVALFLAGLGLFLLLVKFGLEIVSRYFVGSSIGVNSLDPSTEAYALIVYFGLILGGYLIFARLGKAGKLIAEVVWAIVLWYIVLWFWAQQSFAGWRGLDAVIFTLIFFAVLGAFCYLPYILVSGKRPLSSREDSQLRVTKR